MPDLICVVPIPTLPCAVRLYDIEPTGVPREKPVETLGCPVRGYKTSGLPREKPVKRPGYPVETLG